MNKSKLTLDPAVAETSVGFLVLLSGNEFICFDAPLHPVIVYHDWPTASAAIVGTQAQVQEIHFGQLFAMAQAGMWFLLDSGSGDRLMDCLRRVPVLSRMAPKREQTGWTMWGKGSNSCKFIGDLEETNDALARAGMVPPVPPETRIIGFIGLLDGKRMVRCEAGPLHPVTVCDNPQGWASLPGVKVAEARILSVAVMADGLQAGEIFWLEPPVVKRFTSLNLAGLLTLPAPPVVAGDELTGLLVGPRHRPPQEIKQGNGHEEFLATAKNIARLATANN